MSERTDPVAGASATERQSSSDGTLDATGTYETAEGVVLYDTERPLAWLQSDRAFEIGEMR
ncbi:hypothetical protein GRX03_00560 [Halovenus sp. WSH3]|uniref:Uncharacterized protein n=1 Tax=Halovenus carboxidivorans TaxID=2692199 RepID=A0A6B0T4G3_9EURY|nr:hypothetical protein [Halovenus carboxidivorans]MXR50101.1 hypothetical protein [Halovenus carboxidivorans]